MPPSESLSPVGRGMGSGREGIDSLEGSVSVFLSSNLPLTPGHSQNPMLDCRRACALLEDSSLFLPLVPVTLLAARAGLWHLKQCILFPKDDMPTAVSLGAKEWTDSFYLCVYLWISSEKTTPRNASEALLRLQEVYLEFLEEADKSQLQCSFNTLLSPIVTAMA